MNAGAGENWVLVTGAGKRLGRAVALEAARRGWRAALHFRASHTEAQAVAAEIEAGGGQAVLIAADLAAPDGPQKLIAKAAETARAPITALVNSAAAFEWDDAATFSADMFRRQMEVNALAPVLLTQAFAAALPDGARGAVVNFLDFKLLNPYPDHLSYTLSKYALLGATEMLARGLAPRVRVNAVAPGYVLPAPGQPEAEFARLHASLPPLKRGVEPGDVADAVCFLLENAALTGVVLPVDAGLRFTALERDPAFL